MAFEAIGEPTALALVMARASGLIWGLAWLSGATGAGVRSKLAASAVIAIAATPLIGDAVKPPADPLSLGLHALGELAAGAALGLVAGLIASSARLAGEVIGGQSGFSAASALDPIGEGGPASPLSTLGGLVALATFAAIDGPFRMMLALVESYRLGPPAVGAEAVAGPSLAADTFAALGAAIGLALHLAAPAALALIAAQVVVGLLNRGAPALASFALWLPVRQVIGLLLTLVGVGWLAVMLASAWSIALPAVGSRQ